MKPHRTAITYSEVVNYLVRTSDMEYDDVLKADDYDLVDELESPYCGFRHLFAVTNKEFLKDIRKEFKRLE